MRELMERGFKGRWVLKGDGLRKRRRRWGEGIDGEGFKGDVLRKRRRRWGEGINGLRKRRRRLRSRRWRRVGGVATFDCYAKPPPHLWPRRC